MSVIFPPEPLPIILKTQNHIVLQSACRSEEKKGGRKEEGSVSEQPTTSSAFQKGN